MKKLLFCFISFMSCYTYCSEQPNPMTPRTTSCVLMAAQWTIDEQKRIFSPAIYAAFYNNRKIRIIYGQDGFFVDSLKTEFEESTDSADGVRSKPLLQSISRSQVQIPEERLRLVFTCNHPDKDAALARLQAIMHQCSDETERSS